MHATFTRCQPLTWAARMIFAGVLLMGLYACETRKETVSPPDTPPAISPAFNFATTADVAIDVTAKDAQGKPLKMSNIQVFDKDPEMGGTLLLRGGIDQNGKLTAAIALPTYVTEVFMATNYAGVIDHVVVPVTNQTIRYSFFLTSDTSGERVGVPLRNARTAAGKFTYMGTYDSQGIPTYLEAKNDAVSAELLDAINTSLPNLKTVNPKYLAPGVSRDVPVVKDTYISITFISEGAGQKNAMGYYLYPLNQPPVSPAAIAKKMVMFPNASFKNSGGGLKSGNKVKITEKIPAGTGVGFFIVADGWNGTDVSENAVIYYSNPLFNPESSADKQQHSVLLNNEGKYILAFEDLPRDGKSDHDFNDVIFCVTSTVPDAVDDDNIPPVDTPKDCDKDGVPDADDQYPCDPVRAYDNKTVGTLAFEDLWPSKGDFDMNDLVLNYSHNLVTNGQNNVVELVSDFDVLAIGAHYKNGFGFELPKLTPGQVTSVTGTHAGTALESGQQKATILVFNNAFDLAPEGSQAMVNTYAHLSKVSCTRVSVTTKLATPLKISEVGTAPFNPFLIGNQKREYEVHLPGYAPTSKANISVLGTKDDASKPSEGIYYKTREGMPFALHLPVGSFQYPQEMAAIDKAYLKFAAWATSGGTQYADWYVDQSGYRDYTKIYVK